MTWRLNKKEYDQGKGEGNKNSIHNLVKNNEPLGMLAFDGDVAVGWCAVAPREKYVRLEKSRALKMVDDQPVWSISCFFIAKSHRMKGLSTDLLKATIVFAKEHGAKIIEGYPIDTKGKKLPAVFAWTGFTSTFIQAGFKEVKRHTPSRGIFRYLL
jgi:predicted GNAT family acetyltransferase